MKKSFIRSLALILLPLPLFAALCESSSASCQSDGNGHDICVVVDPIPTITVDMTNYSTVIDAALQGEVLPTSPASPIPVTACIAVASFSDFSPTDPNVSYTVNATFRTEETASPDLFPNAYPSIMKIPSSDGNYLGATMVYCPCGFYNNEKCTTMPINVNFNDPANLSYNNPNAPGYNLGWCGEGQNGDFAGALLIQIYSPYGVIPAFGSYQADLGIFAQNLTSSPAKARFVKPTSTPGTLVNPSTTLCFQKKGQPCNTSTPAQFKP